MQQLDDDMIAVVRTQRLCFAATVTPDGRPNLSPKGTIRVLDHRHLFFLDIASPNTRRNLQHNPWMELNVVDQTSRRGYRFFGRATVVESGEVFAAAVRQIVEEEGAAYPTTAVIVLEIERADQLISPGYSHIEDEWKMREVWKKRRKDLDAEFEAHLKARGPLKV